MHITLGLALDGACHPSLIGDRLAALGEIRAGPLGFLSILETRLGLQGPDVADSIRVAQYAARLGAADDGARFFSRSFAVDRIGVARNLLRWRDELVAGGWTAATPVHSASRLADLALVETQLLPLASGYADRLRSVVAAVELRGAPGLTAISLIEPVTEWPLPWRVVLDALAKRGVVIEPVAPPAIRASGDLAALLEYLRGGPSQAPLGDGSVVILEAQSDLEAAEVIATWIGRSTRPIVVLDPALDDTLVRAVRSRGQPIPRIPSASAFRPALQVLGLSIALRWAPFDPLAALQLATLPIGPIPRWMGRLLASALQAAPGIGGKPWLEALDRIDEKSRQHAAKDGRDEQAAALRSRRLVEHWFGGQRFDPREGIPRVDAIEVCRRVAEWANSASRHYPEDALVQAPGAAAQRLATALEHLGSERISRELLNSCLADAIGAGASRRSPAQIGHYPFIREAGALVGPTDTLVWWGFIDDAASGCPASPWRHDERAQLAGAGVALDDLLTRHVERERRALEALAWVRERLVFVVPRRRCGTTVSAHPTLGVVAAAFAGNIGALRVDVRDWVGGATALAMPPVESVEIGFRCLPAVRRWWTIPAGSLAPRERESFTSIDSFVFHPFVWALRYHARLTKGSLEELPDGHLLLGSLAHRLFEDLLSDDELVHRAPVDRISSWVAGRAASLLEQEGAVLMLPGRESDRHRLVACTTRSAQVLIAQIRAGGWTVAGTEVERAGVLAGQPLIGTLDVQLRSDDGRVAVVDIKWGGRRLRAEEFRKLSSLQLALYGHLVRQETGTWPHLAYLIVEDGELLHPAGPHGLTKPLAAEHAARLDDYWDALLESFRWRRDQLDRGLVEVTSENTEADDLSDPPKTALPAGEAWRWGDFVSLTGWIDEE